MKYQKMEQQFNVKKATDPQRSTCMITMIIMLFISLLIWGCATDKAAQEVAEAGIAEEVPDASKRVEPSSDDIVSDLTSQTEEEQESVPRGKIQPLTMRHTPTPKRPLELKPLLAVMTRKGGDSKKREDTVPSIHVELAFDNADVYEVLDVTLYDLFKVNYMMDPSIKAKVTFHLSGDFTKAQFINIMNNVLQLNNLAIVRGPGDIYKVVRRTSSASVSGAPLATEEGSEQAGDITRMIRLTYVAAATAAKNIKPFLSRDAVVVQDTVTNSLVITDTADNLAKAASILGMMDVAQFADIAWRVFQVEEVDASEMAKDLAQILKTGGLYNRPGMDSESFEIIPIKTMNALLVVTRWPPMLKLTEDWITAMDHADDSGSSVFVYFVENGTAVELADILIQLYGGAVTGDSKRVTIVKPTVTEDKRGPAGELYGEVEIIPDETNNAIVFKASGRDYKIIKEVLKKLDIVPRQVLINVVIAEITLDGSLEYGVQWFLKDRAQSNYKFQGRLDDGIDLPIDTPLGGAGAKGLTLALYDSDDLLRGLITALETEGEVNILSSPNILAVDNKEAVIEVGEQVPIPTGETITEGGTTITSIQYRDTGVLLTVTPHINSSGLIKIELIQEVSETGTKDEELNAYSFLNRKAQTSLVIEDGQTIILGGLMRSKLDTSGSGVPFLRSIPLLGYLFGGTSKEISKTELIFLITPRVITTRAEADAITKEFSQRVDTMKKQIEEKDF